MEDIVPCYQCNRCNKCGMLSTRMELTCATCGEPVKPGAIDCPACGASYANNMVRGTMKRIDEATGIAREFDPFAPPFKAHEST